MNSEWLINMLIICDGPAPLVDGGISANLFIGLASGPCNDIFHGSW